jgi:hypothetical protein
MLILVVIRYLGTADAAAWTAFAPGMHQMLGMAGMGGSLTRLRTEQEELPLREQCRLTY